MRCSPTTLAAGSGGWPCQWQLQMALMRCILLCRSLRVQLLLHVLAS
jgi:hypothetical protein